MENENKVVDTGERKDEQLYTDANMESPINPTGKVGYEENGAVSADGEGAPQAAAAQAAAERAEGEHGAEAPPAAQEAGKEDGTSLPPPKGHLYTEEDMARFVTAVVERMASSAAFGRGSDEGRLAEELAAERRLRHLSENKLICIRSLEEAGLPASFADLLVTEDEADMGRRLTAFVSTVREWINREVSMKLETLTPRIGGGDTGITKAQFRAMRIAEQQEIFENNRPLYEELSR